MSTTPRGDQADFDRGWHDDGHTIVPTIETERADVRIVCPGWHDDGHTIVPTIETERADVRIVCPGPDRCKAKYGCEHCNAGGYVYEGGDGEEKPCPVCDEEGIDPARIDRCWLIDTIGFIMSEAEACCNAEQADVTAGHEIVWQDQGSFDDPQPVWKSKGVESYDDRNRRRAAERKAETEAQRVA